MVKGTQVRGHPTNRKRYTTTSSPAGTHQFGLLGIDGVAELEQGLELVVLGERNDLHDGAKLREDLGEVKRRTSN